MLKEPTLELLKQTIPSGLANELWSNDIDRELWAVDSALPYLIVACAYTCY